MLERIILGSHIEPRATKSNPRQEFDESLRPGERMKGKIFDPTWSEKIGKKCWKEINQNTAANFSTQEPINEDLWRSFLLIFFFTTASIKWNFFDILIDARVLCFNLFLSWVVPAILA